MELKGLTWYAFELLDSGKGFRFSTQIHAKGVANLEGRSNGMICS